MRGLQVTWRSCPYFHSPPRQCAFVQRRLPQLSWVLIDHCYRVFTLRHAISSGRALCPMSYVCSTDPAQHLMHAYTFESSLRH